MVRLTFSGLDIENNEEFADILDNVNIPYENLVWPYKTLAYVEIPFVAFKKADKDDMIIHCALNNITVTFSIGCDA